jgi:hypothetical protein
MLPLGFFQDYNPKNKELRSQLVKNLIKTNINEESKLEELFFSDENLDLINKQVILTVWKRTDKQYRIPFQSNDKLLIVMRYVFVEYAKNLPFNIKGQIKELNCIVVGNTLPSIITNIEQYLGYLRDIEKRGELPELPKSTTMNRTLPTFDI